MDQDTVNTILQVALQGEQARGDNGAVLVDTDEKTIVYLLTHEFKPEQFSSKLEDMLSEDGKQYFYIVHKTSDTMHVSKLPKGI